MNQGTFKDKVYKITSLIPKGKVATYGQIARLAGNPRAARAVGYFMRTNPNAPQVPCHRVVGISGKLIGYSGHGGLKSKKDLLSLEGVHFNHGRVDLSLSLWKPSNKVV